MMAASPTPTRLNGDETPWDDHHPFRDALNGNPIRFVSLRDMLDELMPRLGTTVAPSEIGRLLQVLKASGYALGGSRSV